MTESSKDASKGAANPSMENSDKDFFKFSKLYIFKNLIVTSVGCLLIFSAYDGLIMLQSTVNQTDGIGVICVAVQFGCSCITALLLPEYLLEKVGCKLAITICLALFIPYIASNFYPKWILMIPASVLVGLANSLYWAAQNTYLNQLSVIYTNHLTSNEIYHSPKMKEIRSTQQIFKSESNKTTKGKHGLIETPLSVGDFNTRVNYGSLYLPPDTPVYKQPNTQPEKGISRSNSCTFNGGNKNVKVMESVTARFFGIHGLIFCTAYIWSNLISYYMLGIGATEHFGKNITCPCGADFCNIKTECYESNLKEPRQDLRNMLIGVFVAISVSALLLVFFCLDELKKKKKNVSISWEFLIATGKQMKDRKQFLLIPISVNLGVSQGFMMGDFTKDFVGCAWGIHYVGLVTVCFGATFALSSSISGWLVKYLGRVSIFLFAKLLNVSAIIIMLLWTPDPTQKYMFFITAGLLGAALGTYFSQLRAFYGVLFKNKEGAAYANYQIWHAIGMAMTFAYSSYICTSVKIYIFLVISTLGMIGYLFAEKSR